MSAPGALRRVIDTACRAEGASLKDLTVLAPHRDPYRFDTPAGHRNAAWFREHIERLGYLDRGAIALGDAFRTIHLRGCHYGIFSLGGVVKPDGLPSTPLRETERRADRWKREFGVDQTEIDALAALRPDLLRKIARAALDPFFDRTLSHRVYRAQAEWLARAQAALDDRLDGDLLATLRMEAAAKLARLEAEIRAINAALETAVDDIDLDLPPFEAPTPVPREPDGPPLVCSRWSWAEASRALIARKSYGNGGARP